MFMAKQNVLAKTQFTIVSKFCQYCDGNTRLTLQHNLGMITYFIFFATMYFHLSNVCGYTSTVVCMSSEIVEGLVRHDPAWRDARHDYTQVNMTEFFSEQADMYVLRIISGSPEELLIRRS